jgi:hypothetical protein
VKYLLLVLVALSAGTFAFTQVDVVPRRTLQFQMESSFYPGDERPYPIAYFWFNRNDCPRDGTALRVIYAGVYADSELSWFLPSHRRTALGGGIGGGAFSDLITPYVNGNRLAQQQFNVGSLGARLFLNRELAQVRIGDQAELPLNVRVTYGATQEFSSRSSDTHAFALPTDFYTQIVLGEFRFGGIEPGLTANEGLEVYASAEAGFRSGFHAFGPHAALYPEHHDYRRRLLSAAAKIPAGRNTYSARLAGALGTRIDELSAWKVGGNYSGLEPFMFPLHGYYTQEFLAEDFAILNTAWSYQISENHQLAAHLFADLAKMKLVPPNENQWRDQLGAGTGIGFRTPGNLDWLVSYGYGPDAPREGGRGSQEIAVALEKSF